ncbi:unnamed protein product [Vitrella brassicaformis CCMP3155]|uniref:Abnormal spindle-like microcephaly-associated protein ASH domain-containing protein n=4 Tax=Vitrella brassicaformis TaxID=1169539 RepID=A0A0G4EG07_VITBC|nr:unnamed protein product [Vitrella brassicaformis CCMP3155]|eukprot:CEL95461.1 unnamed protein product [Vitrella brassicaformis CCMP3155]
MEAMDASIELKPQLQNLPSGGSEKGECRAIERPMTRFERSQSYGIDCEDELIWQNWTVGGEVKKRLVIRNVSLVTQTVQYKVPKTKLFNMDFPQTIKLPPGMEKVLIVAFRPIMYQPYVDSIEIITKKGTFHVAVKALVREASLTVPEGVDFGLCPVNEVTSVPIYVYNTGTLPCRFRWHSLPPFSVSPAAGCVPVRGAVECTVSFTPDRASVYDATVTCHGRADDGTDVDVLEIEAHEEGQGGLLRQMGVTGIAKVAHLKLPRSAAPEIHFGCAAPGVRQETKMLVQNTTPVRTSFEVCAASGPHEIAPLPPLPFRVTPTRGVIPPEGTLELKFAFQSWTVGETSRQRFQVRMKSGVPLCLTCVGHIDPHPVTISTPKLSFGDVPTGKRTSRVFQLENGSPLPLPYHFPQMDPAGTSVFFLDRPSGVVPASSFINMTMYGWPTAAANYFKRFYCLVKGTEGPLTLDVVLTCFDPAPNAPSRPAPLAISHVWSFRKMQLGGQREFPKDVPPPEREGETAVVAPPEETPTALYMDLLLDDASSLRDICVSPDVLDFGSCSPLTMSQPRVVTVANQTSQKVSCVWLIPEQTKPPLDKGDAAPFVVLPEQKDILPHSSTDFKVCYRPSAVGTFDTARLEANVYPKVNRSFRLVDAHRFTPPWSAGCLAMGNSFVAGANKYVPHSELSETAIRFRPCAIGEGRYHVLQLRNQSDTPMSYRFRDAQLAARLPSTEDESALPPSNPFIFRAYPKCGCVPPHTFHLLLFEFRPTQAANTTPLTATFQLVLNEDDKSVLPIAVAGRAWMPKGVLAHGKSEMFFPPTCAGVAGTDVVPLRNATEIPLTFSCRLPPKATPHFTLPCPSGYLGPAEEVSLPCQFYPAEAKTYATPLYVALRAAADDTQAVLGPLRQLVTPPPAPSPRSCELALRLVGQATGPVLSVSPCDVDLGDVAALDTVEGQVTLHNNSTSAIYYTVEVQFCPQEPSDDLFGRSTPPPIGPPSAFDQPHDTETNTEPAGTAAAAAAAAPPQHPHSPPSPLPPPCDDELNQLDRQQTRGSVYWDQDRSRQADGALRVAAGTEGDGVIEGRCTERIRFTFAPMVRGPHQYCVNVVPFAQPSDKFLERRQLTFPRNTHHRSERRPETEETLAMELHASTSSSMEMDAMAAEAGGGASLRPRTRSVHAAHGVKFWVGANVMHPFFQIVDIRCTTAALSPSHLWASFQADNINRLFRSEVTDGERAFLHAKGIDARKRQLRHLQSFTLDCGAFPMGGVPPYFTLTLHNPAPVDVSFRFLTPKKLSLEDIPLWADDLDIQGQMQGSEEAHYDFVESKRLFEVSPAAGRISARGSMQLRLAYHPLKEGSHVLPVVLSVDKGHSVLLYLTAAAIIYGVPKLQVRASIMHLQPVPLSMNPGPVQAVEVYNRGSSASHWQLDPSSLSDLCRDNFSFQILQCQPLSGVLQPFTTTHIHFVFTPLEAKTYTCPITIRTHKDDTPEATVLDTLTFELHMEGYQQPADGSAPSALPCVDRKFPPTLPDRTFTAPPRCAAFTSLDAVKFWKCPPNAFCHRLLVLSNTSPRYEMHFRWDQQGLLGGDDNQLVMIVPSQGVLRSGHHCLVHFILALDDQPLDISGEVACRVEWVAAPTTTNGEGNGRTSLKRRPSRDDPHEVFATHKVHVHEPVYSKLDPASQQRTGPHRSVVSRLTRSRYFALRATKGGQRCLENQFDSEFTKVSSSHDSKGRSNASAAATVGDEDVLEDPTQVGATLPSKAPLYVRVEVLAGSFTCEGGEADDRFVCVPPLALPNYDELVVGSEEVSPTATDESADMASRRSSKMPDNKRKQHLEVPSEYEAAATHEETDTSPSASTSPRPHEHTDAFHSLPLAERAAPVIQHIFTELFRAALADPSLPGLIQDMLRQPPPLCRQFHDSPAPTPPPVDPSFPLEEKGGERALDLAHQGEVETTHATADADQVVEEGQEQQQQQQQQESGPPDERLEQEHDEEIGEEEAPREEGEETSPDEQEHHDADEQGPEESEKPPQAATEEAPAAAGEQPMDTSLLHHNWSPLTMDYFGDNPSHITELREQLQRRRASAASVEEEIVEMGWGDHGRRPLRELAIELQSLPTVLSEIYREMLAELLQDIIDKRTPLAE